MLLLVLVVVDRRRVQLDFVLPSEKAFPSRSSAPMGSGLIALLEAAGQCSGSLTAHIHLNLVQTLAHAA